MARQPADARVRRVGRRRAAATRALAAGPRERPRRVLFGLPCPNRARARLARRALSPTRCASACPGLEVHWLAQHPVTGGCWPSAARPSTPRRPRWQRRVRAHRRRGRRAPGSTSTRRCAGWTRSWCANFMVFHDVVREEAYDAWIGDEAWELDRFLHENPELKTAPFGWLSDFVGLLPLARGRRARRRGLCADENAEMLEWIERHPAGPRHLAVRGRARRTWSTNPSVPACPEIRPWVEDHFEPSRATWPPGRDPVEPCGRPRRRGLGGRRGRLPGRRGGLGHRWLPSCAGPSRRCPSCASGDPGLRMVVGGGTAARPPTRCPRPTAARCGATCTRPSASPRPATSRWCRAGWRRRWSSSPPDGRSSPSRSTTASSSRSTAPRLDRHGARAGLPGRGRRRRRWPTRWPRRWTAGARYRRVPADGAERAAAALAGLLVATVRG